MAHYRPRRPHPRRRQQHHLPRGSTRTPALPALHRAANHRRRPRTSLPACCRRRTLGRSRRLDCGAKLVRHRKPCRHSRQRRRRTRAEHRCLWPRNRRCRPHHPRLQPRYRAKRRHPRRCLRLRLPAKPLQTTLAQPLHHQRHYPTPCQTRPAGHRLSRPA